MENQPKVSIITVCFNAKEMLITTLEDIRKQKYDNLEYIVVDGKSSDGTLDLLNNYQDIISKIVSEPDKGIYDAMNKGINIATGEWVIFMNAGDTFANENILTRVFKDQIPLLPGTLPVAGGASPKVVGKLIVLAITVFHS